MKKFEIHITGEKAIIDEFQSIGINTINVDLLDLDLQMIRTEYMSSFMKEFETYTDCKKYVDNLVKSLKSEVIRIKIESPVYKEYFEQSLYIESHFRPDTCNRKYPISRNQKSGNLMATDRTTIKIAYTDFIYKWKNEQVELCLFDSFIEEDKDWFDLYKKQKLATNG